MQKFKPSLYITQCEWKLRHRVRNCLGVRADPFALSKHLQMWFNCRMKVRGAFICHAIRVRSTEPNSVTLAADRAEDMNVDAKNTKGASWQMDTAFSLQTGWTLKGSDVTPNEVCRTIMCLFWVPMVKNNEHVMNYYITFGRSSQIVNAFSDSVI